MRRNYLGGLYDSLWLGSFCFIGAMLITPLSATVPLAQASYKIYSLFLLSSLSQGILPLSSPSKILFTFILYHLEGIKFRLAGGKAFTGNGSLWSMSTSKFWVATALDAILPLLIRSIRASCSSERTTSLMFNSSLIVLHQSLFSDFFMNSSSLFTLFSLSTGFSLLSYPKFLNSSYHP